MLDRIQWHNDERASLRGNLDGGGNVACLPAQWIAVHG
jgi:hypothetical protein